MVNDTLSDMLVRIKNAQSRQKEVVRVIGSKLNCRVCDILVQEGFIENYESKKEQNKHFILVKLKYYQNKPVIQTIKRISKGSLRVYAKSEEIPKIVDGFGVIGVSTPKGLMSHLQAIKANVGGELLFIVN